MITERVLLDDGAVVISEATCDETRPASPTGEEVVQRTEISIPLRGVYVRTSRRPGSPSERRTAIGDPGRAILFRPGQPYRIGHPVPGDDRSLVIGLHEGSAAPGGDRAADIGVPAGLTIAARRLARDLAAGRLDPLAAAETARMLLHAIGWEPAGRTTNTTHARDHRVVAATRLEVAARLGERLTLSQLGALVGLSGWELARRFRRVTGTSIHAYRTRLRVQAAVERIDGGERDLTALALDLGFADHSHLTNVVRRTTGQPPSAFRIPRERHGELRTIVQA